ncbi:acyl-CoA thioesterase [Halioxenophilus aromaticivorans]|uniref:Thioesterase family protein n=1 Tax=Halioxenophilus aromaticivorans TaxID=1306992 RepID=A0AAV3U2P2_9ALTE
MVNPDSLRDQYAWFLPLTTRWMDNDIYGHINNVQYYSYFDTVTNHFLIEQCGLDIRRGDAIGYIVHSECNYLSGVAFPATLEGGLKVNKLGNSSVQYGLGIFEQGKSTACAFGNFTHVFVDRESERPVPIPLTIRTQLERLSQTRPSQ